MVPGRYRPAHQVLHLHHGAADPLAVTRRSDQGGTAAKQNPGPRSCSWEVAARLEPIARSGPESLRLVLLGPMPLARAYRRSIQEVAARLEPIARTRPAPSVQIHLHHGAADPPTV